MFNLSHPKTHDDVWSVDPMLFTDKGEDKRFSGQDWDKVPKVAYETALFRKLAPPRIAKVVTNPSSFVLETYGAPAPVQGGQAKSTHTKDFVPTQEELDQEPVGIELTPTSQVEPEDGNSNALDPGVHGTKVTDGSSPDFESAQSLEPTQISEPTEQSQAFASELDSPTAGTEKQTDPELSEHTVGTRGAEHAESSAQSEQSPLDAPKAPDPVENSDLHSSSFEEGYQLGLLKGIEKAHAEDLEEFQAERLELQSQVSTYKALEEAWNAKEASMQAKIEELTQALEAQTANLDQEREALKAQNASTLEAQMKLLEEVTSKLEDFVNHPQRLFEPLKRLSVHIAEQLVLAELNLSGASIERLIQRCLDELSSHSNQTVTVELNTQDKARLQELTGELFNHIQLHAVSSMQPGSVRVITDDTQVDDLIGHRLEAMANNLLAQPELWREQSPFFKQPLAQRDTDIEDVRQRLTPMVERNEENQDD